MIQMLVTTKDEIYIKNLLLSLGYPIPMIFRGLRQCRWIWIQSDAHQQQIPRGKAIQKEKINTLQLQEISHRLSIQSVIEHQGLPVMANDMKGTVG